MKDDNLIVRSQLIPLHEMRLVLPNTAIAEVISYRNPQPLEGMDNPPQWLLGMASWRGLKIPLISFETAAADQAPQTNKRSRVIVLNTLLGSDTLPFYGLVAQGIPRLMGLDRNNILDAPNADEQQPFVLRQVVVEGHPAVIPDQKSMEKELTALGAHVVQEEEDIAV
jgi:chemosensory pili system protein ChpC